MQTAEMKLESNQPASKQDGRQQQQQDSVSETSILHRMDRLSRKSRARLSALLHPSQPATTLARGEKQTDRTCQGLVNFTAILSHDSTQREKMDSEWSIRGTVVKLPGKPSRPQNMSSKITDTLNILSKPNQQQQEQQQQQQQSTSSSPYEPSETVLLNSLASAAQEWNVSKTGCGAIDFHELLGGLQSPFLESPKIPRAPADLFSRFVTQICPTIGAQPILIHDRQVLHLPPPTDSIKLEEIQTLVRYLLSLLGGSEAKRQLTPTRPATNANLIVQQERNAIMKRLSGFDFSTLANLQPKWASASLVIPSNLFENNNIETDSLDQLLRADIGLPPPITSPPQLVRIKSSLSDPEIVKATPSSSRMASLRSTSSIGTNLLSSSASRSKLGYPHNLLMIYAPVKTTPFGVLLHYPDNLENLSNDPFRLTRRVNDDERQCDERVQEANDPLLHTWSIEDNPRSSDFNVEHALADAMSERSIGSLAALEFVRSKPFIEPSSTKTDSTTPVLKQIPIYVNNGRMTSSVYWIQIEGWTLAWVVGPSDEGDHHFPSSISSSCGASVIDGSSDGDGNETIVKHARAVLVALIESNGLEIVKFRNKKQQRRGPLNEIWPGKIIPADEVEVSLGLLRLLDHRFVGKVAGPSSKPFTSGIMSQFEESFLRTKSGQWIVTKKIHHHSHIDQQQQQQVSKNEEDEHPQQHPLDRPHESGRFLDAFLVLPSGFGTLIEADNEMRILERQSELLEMSIV
ncbi:hypothetical protein KEM48_000099 [Puccinia striiformis f. sp. tritici PST-130]|nr:hypothetical protein KEM48_000099 [Puccinia striiformis f. sp. tritici PST-130]